MSTIHNIAFIYAYDLKGHILCTRSISLSDLQAQILNSTQPFHVNSDGTETQSQISQLLVAPLSDPSAFNLDRKRNYQPNEFHTIDCVVILGDASKAEFSVTECCVTNADGAAASIKGVAFFPVVGDDKKAKRLAFLVKQILTISAFDAVAPTQTNLYPDSLLDSLATLFDTEFRNVSEGDMWNVTGRDSFKKTASYYVDRQLPIEVVLPAFPCKSPNLDKVTGTQPDKGEELAYRTMHMFAEAVKKMYPPGAKFKIVSDGHVFSDLLGVDDDLVLTYGHTIHEMTHELGLTETFEFRTLKDLLIGKATHETIDELEVEDEDVQRDFDCGPCSADDDRKLLNALFGATKDMVREEVKGVSEVNRLFRGFSKFLFQDLASTPMLTSLPSKSAQKKHCAKLAYNMISRNRAYSDLVQLMFPMHVRISIHPHNCAGPKFGVRLIHSSYLYHGLQASAESQLFHIPTPWHNAVICDTNGKFLVMKSKEARESYGGSLVSYPDGRPSHFQIAKTFDDVIPSKKQGLFLDVSSPRPSCSSYGSTVYSFSSDGSKLPPSPLNLSENGSSATLMSQTAELANTIEPSKPQKDVEKSENVPAIVISDGDSGKEAPKPPPYSAYSKRRRMFFLILVALAGFLGPFAGNIYLPALNNIRSDLGISEFEVDFSVSMFMLTFAIAPLFWSTFADVHGRRTVYIVSLAIFTAASVALFFTNSYAMLMSLRILQAIGAAAVQSVGAGTIVDLFSPTERGASMGIFLLGPQFGPIIGSLIGGSISNYLNWKWNFLILAGVGFMTWTLIFLMLPETLRKRMDNGEDVQQTKKLIVLGMPTMSKRVAQLPAKKEPLVNPLAALKFLKYKPIALCVTYIAIIFGSFYCLTVKIATVFGTIYKFSDFGIGAAYCGLGVGFVCGSMVGGRCADYLLKRDMQKRGIINAKEASPEIRVRCQVPGLVCFPLGLFLFGLGVQLQLHPAVIILFLFITAFGMTWTFSCNTTYLVDSFPGSAASVVALNSLFRNPSAAVGSAVIDLMVKSMGILGAFGLISSIDVLGASLVVIVMIYGAKWRKEFK